MDLNKIISTNNTDNNIQENKSKITRNKLTKK